MTTPDSSSDTPAGEPAAKPDAAAKAAAAKAAAAKAAAAKAGGAKPAAKAKAAKEPAKPFEDNGDGTVTDPTTGLMWKKSDAWLDTKQFYLWKDHRQYVDKINKEKFAGYDNWRIPTKAEAVTLVDKSGQKKCLDKNGTEFPVDPVFEPGCAAATWISECSDDKIVRFDLKIGIDTVYPALDVWSSIWLVRKPGEAAAVIETKEETPPAEVSEAAKPAEASAAPAAPKPAAVKPSGKATETTEQRLARVERAKARAEEIKAKFAAKKAGGS